MFLIILVFLDENKFVGFLVKDILLIILNNNYKYRILGGNIDEVFCINYDGVISVVRFLDREKIFLYLLKVFVFVGNKVSNMIVDVRVRDKNDDVFWFIKVVYFFEVSEDKGK